MIMKILERINGGQIVRVSRWIKVNELYDITPRHNLYDYATDENGYKTGEEKYNGENGNYCNYFVFRGKKYAIEQFIAMNGVWCMQDGYVEKGEKCYLSGYDADGDIYYPIMIEWDEYCEHVRVYMDYPDNGLLSYLNKANFNHSRRAYGI